MLLPGATAQGFRIEKVKLSNNEAVFTELGFRPISPQTMLRGTETKLSRPEALSIKPTPACRKPSKHGFPFGQPCQPRESIGPNPEPKLRTYAAGRSRLDIRCAELGFRPIHFTRNLGTIRFTAQSVSLGSALRGIRFGHHHQEPHKVNPTPNQEPQGYAAHVLSLVFIFRQDLCPGSASPQI